MARAMIAGFLNAHDRLIRVTVSRTMGSVPRDAGTMMLVADHTVQGTIGGGQLEYIAIDEARAMLRAGLGHKDMDIPLGPGIGQCCGGRVILRLDEIQDADRGALIADEIAQEQAQPHVYIFGSGHVGRALAQSLALLPLQTILVDSRMDELGQATADVIKRPSALPEAEIRAAPPGSSFVVLTHDHGLDFLLTAEALARRDAAYVGMIGSATKRARLVRYCREECDNVPTDRLICPIGAAGGGDKRPAIIAAMVTAEILAALMHPGDPVASASNREHAQS